MGHLSISSTAGANGSSYTNWENFERLVDRWKILGAIIGVVEEKSNRPTHVIAEFPDGIRRSARYTPYINELKETH